MRHASQNEINGAGRLAGALAVGVAGAVICFAVTLAAGQGVLLAFLAYMLSGMLLFASVIVFSAAVDFANARIARRARRGGRLGHA